jgi:hypothetical protein
MKKMNLKIKTIFILQKSLSNFCLFISFLIFLSCGNNSFEEKLYFSINNNVVINEEKENIILFLSDADCYSCYVPFYELKNTLKTQYIGLFYSKYPNEFRKRTLKINQRIKWEQLKNRDLLDLINDNVEEHGPYMVSIKDGKLTFL